MKIISGARSSGKTTRAFEWLRERENRVLVVPTALMASTAIQSHGVGLPRAVQRVISWDHARTALLGQRAEVGLDETGWILRQMLGNPVSMMTVNAPVEHEEIVAPCFHRAARAMFKFMDRKPAGFCCDDCGEQWEVR